jgi:nucleoside-diphosphate-sugar epimerase
MKYQCCIIFGGAGYIGSFFAGYLIENEIVDEIILADISLSKKEIWPRRTKEGVEQGKIRYVECDVRVEKNFDSLPTNVDLICNFAAIHREPGHSDIEFFETNIQGAENICAWADDVGAKRIIFTSSIAPYGILEREKRENTIPVPVTAYGSSKLVAEKIHIAWQNKDITNRFLSIVRPGVIFGPGEDGNMPRMIKAVNRRYFFYMGNKETRKAGGYVKELVSAMWWVLQKQSKESQGVVLYNFTSKVVPTIQDYLDAICEVSGVTRFVPSVPYSILLLIAYVIDGFARPLGIPHPFSPVRIRKLVRSNNVVPTFLIDNAYPYQYDL